MSLGFQQWMLVLQQCLILRPYKGWIQNGHEPAATQTILHQLQLSAIRPKSVPLQQTKRMGEHRYIPGCERNPIQRRKQAAGEYLSALTATEWPKLMVLASGDCDVLNDF